MSCRSVGPCPRPQLVKADGEVFSIRCKSRRCRECGKLWAGDQRTRLVGNLARYDGPMRLGTATAPGDDLLGDPASKRWWNLYAPTHWRLLSAEAQKRVQAECGIRATLLCWVWELQRRGVLHKHFVLGVKTAAERRAADLYIKHLDELRGLYGFGFIDRGRWDYKRRRRSLRDLSGLHAGRYVAKYLVKLNEHGQPEVAEMVRRSDVPPLVVYVSRVLTAATGITMRALRERRYAYATAVPASLEVIIGILQASGCDASIVDGLVAAANAPPQ